MFDIFKGSRFKLYLVGGSVRDRLLGMTPVDHDYATDGKPHDIIDFLTERGIKVIPTGVAFGTVTAIHPATGEKAEITTFRSAETYRRGSRHPIVAFGRTIEEDLQRRDFTMNAMAIDADGRLIDPFDGSTAIEQRIIDTPGDPNSSFIDDPLRILRAYRFSAKLGFLIARRIRRAARNLADELSVVSAERKYRELTGLLVSESGKAAADALDMMKRDGVLMRVLPELENMFVIDGLKQGKYHHLDAWQHTLKVLENVPPQATVRWAALLHDAAKGLVRTTDDSGEPHFHRHEIVGETLVNSIADRLRFPRSKRKTVAFLVRNHMRPVLYRKDWGNSAVRRLIRDSGDQLENLLLLAEADILAHEESYVRHGLEGLEELRGRILDQDPGRIIPADMGHRLSALGFEGPVIGRILDRLEDMAADGLLPEDPTVDQCFSALWEYQAGKSAKEIRSS